jgi:type II secretory pathway pseudopilin PulG
MKLTNTPSMKRKSGMTLLELTVVILVLLSLISILFIGARAWKKGSDRSANIMNVRNIQQAVRGQQNSGDKKATEAVDVSATTGLWIALAVGTPANSAGYLAEPKPPTGAISDAYEYNLNYDVPGILFVSNPDIGDPVGEYFYDATETVAKTGGW